MFDKDYFQEDITTTPSKTGQTVGGFGEWGLHISKVLFLIYSGYHGISASVNYAGSSELAKAAQIFGIVVLEITLFSLYLAWHNQKVTGIHQSIAAGLTYAIGFILACLGIVADSQLHGGLEMSGWLVAYLKWGLPVAPAIMALGALLTHELAPRQLRQRKETAEKLKFADEQFTAYMASQRAQMETGKVIKNMQLNAQASAARQIAQWFASEQAQRAITATARQNAPALLRAIGVDIEDVPDVNESGDFDLEDLVHYLVEERLKAMQQPPVNITPQTAVPSQEKQPKAFRLDDLLQQFGKSKEEVRELVKRYGLTSPDKAYSTLASFGYLPEGMDTATFTRLYDELMGEPAGIHHEHQPDFLSANGQGSK